MTLLTDAQVTILMADYAATDNLGKLNITGGGVTFIGQQPTGASAPFSLLVQVGVPERKYVGTEYSLTIELQDVTTGRLVQMPGEAGAPQPLRAQQVVSVQPLTLGPGLAKPSDAMVSSTIVMNFPGGLPLELGHSFEWRVQIDGQSRHFFYRFHMLAPSPGVVFGGPANSPIIPGFGEYVVDAPETEEPEQPEPPADPTPS